MDVFDPEVPDVDYDENVLKAQLKAWIRVTMKLPPKKGHGFQGAVIPIQAYPLIIGMSDQAGYKILDVRETLDDAPDICWHDWLRFTAGELSGEHEGEPRPRDVKIRPADILKMVTGGKGSVPELVGELLKRILR